MVPASGCAARRVVAVAQDVVAAPGGQDQMVELLSPEARAPMPSSRAQRLKDMVYLKEMRAAITSGEFALRLRGAEQPGLINYQGLCSRFEALAAKLRLQPLETSVLPAQEAQEVLRTLESMSSRLEDRVRDMAAAGAPQLEEKAVKEMPNVLPDLGNFLFLREDRTVDFDGALSEANKAARFSRDLWERLSGGGEEGFGEAEDAVVVESEMLEERRRRSEQAEKLARDAEQELSELLSRAADPSQLGRASELRRELREAEQFVRERRARCLLTSIDLLLERAAATLEAELERTSVGEWDTSGPQLKLSVVEFSLLDKQAAYYWQFMPEDPEVCIGEACTDISGALDPEELRVLESDALEFATDIGIEVEEKEERKKTPFSDVQRLFSQLEKNLEKAKTGFAFYTTGGQLLWQDMQYGASLFAKAAFSNYTLKPREVRALQRTGKDLVVLVPFLVILIIPLTPIGHVLVFSFIQKFFPDFFPSTFTERRQNVVKIYQDLVPGGGAVRRA